MSIEVGAKPQEKYQGSPILVPLLTWERAKRA